MKTLYLTGLWFITIARTVVVLAQEEMAIAYSTSMKTKWHARLTIIVFEQMKEVIELAGVHHSCLFRPNAVYQVQICWTTCRNSSCTLGEYLLVTTTMTASYLDTGMKDESKGNPVLTMHRFHEGEPPSKAAPVCIVSSNETISTKQVRYAKQLELIEARLH